MRKRITPGVVLGCIAVGLAMSGSAVAGSLITSAKIKDGTIQNRDIKKGTIALNRLTPAAQRAVTRAAQTGAKGEAGLAGATGAAGATGPQGATGTTLQASPGVTPTAGNWGLVNRNTIGSPTAFLRSGPADPAIGDGALNLSVRDGLEKVAWGNETDFVGDRFDGVTELGFRVYTTGENTTAGGATPNMPGIIFEVDPNVAGKASNYSSLVFIPENTASNQWSGYIDATSTGRWGGTGTAFAGTTCALAGTLCTFDELQTYLNDADGEPATIMSVAIGKGRDFFWSGAVDGLRINDTVFDFEEDEVVTTTP